MKVKVRKYKDKYETYISYKDIYTNKTRTKRVGLYPTRTEAIISGKKITDAEIKAICNVEDILDKKEVTLNYCIEKSIDDLMCQNKTVSTIKSYTAIWKKHIKNQIGWYKINSITHSMLQTYINTLSDDYSRSTVLQIKYVLKLAYKYSVLNGIVISNITDDIYIKKDTEKAQDNFLELMDLKKLFNHTEKSELGLIIKFGAMVGLRISEILALTMSDIDVEKKEVSINKILINNFDNQLEIQNYTKNKKAYTTIIPDVMLEDLKRHIEMCVTRGVRDKKVEKFLFLNKSRNNYKNPISVRSDFNKIIQELGIKKISFHGLRHSYATMLFDNDIPIETVSKMLNHKNVTTTQSVYTHLTDTRKRAISESVSSLFE